MVLPKEFSKGENKNIEYKEQLPENNSKYLKTVVAFCNTSGGKIVIGIKDDSKEVIGVPNDDVFRIMDGIANAISDNISPQVIPNIYMQAVENKTVIVIEIYPGNLRPYYIKSLGKEKGTYVRIGGTSRPTDKSLLRELELSGMGKSHDTQVKIGEKINIKVAKDLCKTITKYKKSYLYKKGIQEDITEVTLSQLERWEVLQSIDGELKPTIALDLLTENTNSFAKIQCGRFKGKTRSIFIDKKEMVGPIYEQIEEAYQFVLNHINLGIFIDKIYRNEQYEIPTVVIREAIANAVTHRNYMDMSSVQVLVFDDRLEVTSPGMLYGGLTVELIKTGKSKIRNKAIAEVFAQMGIIESWGTGIQRMIDGCIEAGIPEPVFEELGDSFRVTIYRNEDMKDTLKGAFVDHNGNNTRDIILIGLRKKDLTRKEIEELTKLSKSGSRYLLNQLIEEKLVYTVGRGRATKYRLK